MLCDGNDNPVSQRFAVSLCEWAEIQAGEKTAINAGSADGPAGKPASVHR